MKTDEAYTLNKDLELKNENIIVKKGTIVSLTNLYNKTDETIPTVVEVKFENINGNYHFQENIFKTLVTNNTLTALPNRLYADGSCVILSEGSKGKIYSAKYISLGGWFYNIDLSDGSGVQIHESGLTPTNC